MEAALKDHINHTSLEFSGNDCHDSFLDHLRTAIDFYLQKPHNYHFLTHKWCATFLYVSDSFSGLTSVSHCGLFLPIEAVA